MQVTTLCRTPQDAENLVAWLRERGYEKDEISLLLHERASDDWADMEAGVKSVPEEQALHQALPLMGTATGISVASALAGIALIGGPIGLSASGPLALLLGAVGAASAGGIVGVLAGAGIPDDDAERYADELARGGVLASVTPRAGDEQTVRDFFARFG